MRILNLYAGIGGNRKLWGDEHQVTAVENVDRIADVYARFYPQDTLIREDAHQYLLDHHKEFDFIWSSPPCQTHSRFNSVMRNKGVIRYPDMRLYQEILMLKSNFAGKWVVENVIPYYRPLIMPTVGLDRHLFWANFPITVIKFAAKGFPHNYRATWEELAKLNDIELPAFVTRVGDKTLMLRNVANPTIGAHILKAAMRETKQETML